MVSTAGKMGSGSVISCLSLIRIEVVLSFSEDSVIKLIDDYVEKSDGSLFDTFTTMHFAS